MYSVNMNSPLHVSNRCAARACTRERETFQCGPIHRVSHSQRDQVAGHNCGNAVETRWKRGGNGEGRLLAEWMKPRDEKSAIFLPIKSIPAEPLKARADNARDLGGLIATHPSFSPPFLFLLLSRLPPPVFPLSTVPQCNTVTVMFRCFFHFPACRWSFHRQWICYCSVVPKGSVKAELDCQFGKECCVHVFQ